jgi:hypothetical protein
VIAFRLLVLVAVWLLGTSTLSLAQESQGEEPAPEAQPAEPEASEEEDGILLVPDVRGFPYVFAKGVLEDAGFAWKVEGKVEGFAVNLVAEQSVKPGTKVIDTGAPTIVLRLEKNPDYEEKGLPDDSSPYPGTKVVLANGGTPEAAVTPEAEDEETAEDEDSADEQSSESGTTEPEDTGETEPAGTEPAGTGEQYDDTTDVNVAVDADVDAGVTLRPPAFVVPGAPEEPLDEMTLPDRAKKLLKWVDELEKATPAALDHFTYQHAWVVTGALFGWWHGEEALQVLIQADEQMQEKFGVGADSEAEARAALAEVRRKSRAG